MNNYTILNKFIDLVIRQKRVRLFITLTIVFTLGVSPAFADRPTSAFGHYAVTPNLDFYDFLDAIAESEDGGIFELEFGEFSVWDEPFFVNGDAPGVWGAVNHVGRVRARATTGRLSDEPSEYMRGHVMWLADFIRDSANNPTFTLNESNILVQASQPGAGLLLFREKEDGTIVSSEPYASMNFTVNVYLIDSAKVLYENVFSFYGKMQGIGSDLATLKVKKGSDITTREEPFSSITPKAEGFGYIFEIPSITREIDLLGIGIKPGDKYRVEYRLDVGVGEDSTEHYAQADMGDPFDTDEGGFEFTTTDSPFSDNALVCEEMPDPTRYNNQGDGTVIDTHTGLMWQRCPVGYTLDNINTDDLTDDLCVADTINTSDWQGALLNADSNILAGHDDWLVPNVKQLETLIELSCAPSAIDSRAFPETPPSAFWTSTSEVNAEQAWQVSFGLGDIFPQSKLQASSVRLVRNSGLDPVAPIPGLLISNVWVDEGDAGNTSMDFVLSLSRPASTDVTVDYVTEGFTATEGTDYQAATGKATILAGELETIITVTVIGDTDVEGRETLQLSLSDPPADVYFANSAALGVISDDEPFISVIPIEEGQQEGDSGSIDYEFIVTLDKPASALVSIDYTTADGTATAGQDYVASSGTAVINIGESSTPVLVSINGDTTFESDETLQLIISNPMGGSLSSQTTASGIILNDDGGTGSFVALNDTGQRHFSTGETFCADGTSAMLSCPQAGFPNQDGEFGRDVTHNDDGDGIAGFSFTKLDENGDALANQQLSYQFNYLAEDPTRFALWECVEDEVTGLTWETKTDVADDLRNAIWTYTWYNSTDVNDGGEPGTENGGVCADTSNCDTEKYVAAVNATGMCGHSDWRLPSIDELYTIGVAGNTAVGAANGLDDDYFPHNYSVNGSAEQGFTYWSNNGYALTPQSAWVLEFQAPDPRLTQVAKSTPTPIRLVRGQDEN